MQNTHDAIVAPPDGSCVRLKTGGPYMTVEKSYHSEHHQCIMVETKWFDNHNNLKQGGFKATSLIPVELIEVATNKVTKSFIMT